VLASAAQDEYNILEDEGIQLHGGLPSAPFFAQSSGQQPTEEATDQEEDEVEEGEEGEGEEEGDGFGDEESDEYAYLF